MEYDAVEHLQDENEDSMTNGVAKSDSREMNVKDVPGKDSATTKDTIEIKRAGGNVGDNVEQGAASADMETCGEVNMEASVTADDIIKAGGFGARDDISSFLPVAIDSTDFEASPVMPEIMKNHRGKSPGLVLDGLMLKCRNNDADVSSCGFP